MNDTRQSTPLSGPEWQRFEAWWETQDADNMDLAYKMSAWNGWLAHAAQSETARRFEETAEITKEQWDALKSFQSSTRRAIIAECIQAVSNEYLEDPVRGSDGDIAYQAAVAHCVGALRVLEEECTQPEAKDEIKLILQRACDRDWKDENLYQTANIAANAIYWRDRQIALLKAELERRIRNG